VRHRDALKGAQVETELGSEQNASPTWLDLRTLEKPSGDGQPFVDLVREHNSWLEGECREVAKWVREQIGVEPDGVRLSPAWFGEDKQVGVLVFRASITRKPDAAAPPVTDWWVIREQSGQRWIYPCLLSTAGDTVRYHYQIRTIQMQKQ